ncbi:sensor histidine kinase [Shinella sp. NM-101]|uniref:sensor histidine kinase n=1 Tax=Shinella sp. NM-101 TaxID=2744455 RepID=UPI001F1B1F9D|nr:ATP-binding protein [Shinella sp. NM-101]
MLTALACGIALIAASAAFLLRQPWLGLQLDASVERGIRVVGVFPGGPSAGIRPDTVLTAIGNPAGVFVPLEPFDMVEDPDTAPTYAAFDDFLDRQSRIAGLLDGGEVRLTAADGAVLAVRPAASRPLASLPPAFWLQEFIGLACLLVGTWAYCLKPRDPAVRVMALASAASVVTAWASAIFIYRELALDGRVIHVLSSLNLAGALGFAGSILVLFLIHPRRLVPRAAVLLVAAVPAAAWLADVLRIGLETPATQRYLVIMLLLAGSLVAAGIQYLRARGDPLARTALKWFGISLSIGVVMYVLANAVPALAGRPAGAPQVLTYAFALLLNGGLVVAVVRYRLFELDAWAFRILFYTFGAVLLLGLDALLVYVVSLDRAPALGAALLLVAFLYLPLRDGLARRFAARSTLDRHTLLRAVVDVAFGSSDGERAARWQGLLGRLFDPLDCAAADRPVAAAAIRHEGLELAVPAVAGAPALLLRRPRGGRGLFGPNDAEVAAQLVGVMRHVEASRDAYERGAVEERRRIAADLHDDVGARLLTGLHREEPGEIKQALREAMADVRTIAVGLSGDRQALGLVLADLRHEAGQRLDQAGIDLAWSERHDGASDPFLVYRTYRNLVSAHRELVSNVIRHAGARRLEITVAREDGRLRLVFEDDGAGFGTGPASGRGSGLANVRRRVSALDGEMALGASRHGGARVELVLPLAEAAS